MSLYLNKAIVIGNLTRDPETKAIPNGMKVTSFSVATNRTWKDKNGVKQEGVDFHNIVVFGRTAEIVAQYMKKGSNIMVEGRMQTRSWDDKATNTKKYRTEIIADSVQFGPKAGASTGDYKNSAQAEGSQAPKEDKISDEKIEYPTEDIAVEDIPF